MPPKAKAEPVPSKSTELVPVDVKKRQLFKNSRHTKRNDKGERPTTERALVLRNGKHGSMGTGEIMLTSKITGREKLDLLAEDLMKRAQTAVMRKFNLEDSLKIAESQCYVFLDDITSLHDPGLFYGLVNAELKARTPQDKEVDKTPSNVAIVISSRIHNSYMLASAWRLIYDNLGELAMDGLSDKDINKQLKADEYLRGRYLALYDIVSKLVDQLRDRFGLFATTAPHYARYFKPKDGEYVFDWDALREAGRSFMDSIILEMCFPRAPYSQAVLFDILRDAIDESPKEAKRFPQVLFDAVGDLSVAVQLQLMLEAPLVGPDGEKWKSESRELPEEYLQWEVAQDISERAMDNYTMFKNIIYPLEKTRKKEVLEGFWKLMNENFKKFSEGEDIDTVWQLNAAFELRPQWTAFYTQGSHQDDSDGDDVGKPKAVAGKSGKKKPLALTNGPGGESDDSMPELQSVSNSSESESDSDFDSTDDELDDDNESDDSGYDTEEEDELRDMLREAMDTAHEQAFFDSAPEAQIDPLDPDERKGNPFLKLLGSLRGRMFSSNPKMKTGARAPSGAQKQTPRPFFSRPSAPPKTEQKSQKVTIEEVEDEEEVTQKAKKKKKKKKKSKPKKKTSTSIQPEDEDEDEDVAEESVRPASPVQTQPSAQPSPKASPKKAAPTTKKKAPPAVSSNYTAPGYMSTTSLNQTTAQSARSYLQSEGLDDIKSKVKSRFSGASRFLSRLTTKEKSSEAVAEEKKATNSYFSKLRRKPLETLLCFMHATEEKTKPVKWDNFVKMMHEMGFAFDPSTAGSSVRFDPPNKEDKPISVHRPHPENYLTPYKVHEIGARLRRHYGWTREDIEKHLG